MASSNLQIHAVSAPFSWRFPQRCVLLVTLLLGFGLRFYGLDWARGYYFQPDESVHTIDYLLRLPPSLNPYDVGPYTYGGLPLYLYLFTARLLSWLFHNPA